MLDCPGGQVTEFFIGKSNFYGESKYLRWAMGAPTLPLPMGLPGIRPGSASAMAPDFSQN